MGEIKIKIGYAIIITVVLLGIGFFIGRSTNILETTIEHVQKPERPILPPDIGDPIITVPDNPDLPPEVIKPEVIIKYYPDVKYTEDIFKDRYYLLLDSIKQSKLNITNSEVKVIKTGIPDNVDIEALYKDYISSKDYQNQVMFDNEFGKYTLSYKIQYNRMKEFYNAKFTPIETVVTQYKVKRFVPYIEAGYNTAQFVEVGGGIEFSQNWGIGYNYNIDVKNNKLENRSGHSFKFRKLF